MSKSKSSEATRIPVVPRPKRPSRSKRFRDANPFLKSLAEVWGCSLDEVHIRIAWFKKMTGLNLATLTHWDQINVEFWERLRLVFEHLDPNDNPLEYNALYKVFYYRVVTHNLDQDKIMNPLNWPSEKAKDSDKKVSDEHKASALIEGFEAQLTALLRPSFLKTTYVDAKDKRESLKNERQRLRRIELILGDYHKSKKKTLFYAMLNLNSKEYTRERKTTSFGHVKEAFAEDLSDLIDEVAVDGLLKARNIKVDSEYTLSQDQLDDFEIKYYDRMDEVDHQVQMLTLIYDLLQESEKMFFVYQKLGIKGVEARDILGVSSTMVTNRGKRIAETVLVLDCIKREMTVDEVAESFQTFVTNTHKTVGDRRASLKRLNRDYHAFINDQRVQQHFSA